VAYSVPTYDTRTRAKISQQADQFSGDYAPYFKEIQGQGDMALQRAFAAAQQNIGQQFTPAFRMAQQRLGGSPLLADSGYANRLNRQLQTSAYGDLSNQYGQAAASQAQQQQSLLAQLIQQKLAARNEFIQGTMAGTQKKKGFGDYAGAVLGAGIGAFGGPALGAAGEKWGKSW
jgi:hypothetical protein